MTRICNNGAEMALTKAERKTRKEARAFSDKFYKTWNKCAITRILKHMNLIELPFEKRGKIGSKRGNIPFYIKPSKRGKVISLYGRGPNFADVLNIDKPKGAPIESDSPFKFKSRKDGLWKTTKRFVEHTKATYFYNKKWVADDENFKPAWITAIKPANAPKHLLFARNRAGDISAIRSIETLAEIYHDNEIIFNGIREGFTDAMQKLENTKGFDSYMQAIILRNKGVYDG